MAVDRWVKVYKSWAFAKNVRITNISDKDRIIVIRWENLLLRAYRTATLQEQFALLAAKQIAHQIVTEEWTDTFSARYQELVSKISWEKLSVNNFEWKVVVREIWDEWIEDAVEVNEKELLAWKVKTTNAIKTEVVKEEVQKTVETDISDDSILDIVTDDVTLVQWDKDDDQSAIDLNELSLEDLKRLAIDSEIEIPKEIKTKKEIARFLEKELA